MSYKTYKEAKLAMPLACIIHDTDNDRFFGMPSREGTTLTDDGCEFANPIDHLQTVYDFLNDGNRFVFGDIYVNEAGRVFTVDANILNYNSLASYASTTCVLRAAALESQMNIDNLAIQTPEEKEALDLIDTTPHQYEMSKFSGKPRTKVEYVKCEFDSVWEAIKSYEINDDLYYCASSTPKYEKMKAGNMKNLLDYSMPIKLYRRIENQMTEQEAFIDVYGKVRTEFANQSAIVDFCEFMYNSGQFKLVESN